MIEPTRRRRLGRALGAYAVLVTTIAALSAAPQSSPQQPPPSQPAPQQPTFRAGVDLVELDVSVLDKDRHPVRGLTTKDFTVLEDGRAKTVEVFSPVDLPDPPPVTAEWMKSAPVDVDTNNVTQGRLFVIVIDDQNLVGLRIPAAAAARKVIASLGPTDLAAVVFTGDSWNGQSFTADRGRLVAAVNTIAPLSSAANTSPGRPAAMSASGDFQPPRPGRSGPPPCMFLDVLEDVIDGLKVIPHRRKFVINISAASTCQPKLLMAGADGFLLTRAQIADINVYSVSPVELNPMSGPAAFLNSMAESTGGNFLNSNRPDDHVAEIFQENESYYVLGFVSTNEKDRDSLKRIEVKVDRPDVEVRTRTLYDAPSKSEQGQPPKRVPKTSAISELVPKSDVALEATASAFADNARASSTVLVVLGVHEPGQGDQIDVKGEAFDTDGKLHGNFHEVAAFGVVDGEARGEVLARLPLGPGRYQLRISAASHGTGKEGSVYTDVIVPDFAKEPVSLSGMLIAATPGLRAAPRDVAAAIVPVLPTAERTFAATRQVTAFVRVYQNLSDAAASVTMRLKVVDDHDQVIVDRPTILPAGAFTNRHAADFRVTLPIASWHPGPYLVSLSATRGSKVATRDLQLTVK